MCEIECCLTFELDLDGVKVNQPEKYMYLCQRSSGSKSNCPHTHLTDCFTCTTKVIGNQLPLSTMITKYRSRKSCYSKCLDFYLQLTYALNIGDAAVINLQKLNRRSHPTPGSTETTTVSPSSPGKLSKIDITEISSSMDVRASSPPLQFATNRIETEPRSTAADSLPLDSVAMMLITSDNAI